MTRDDATEALERLAEGREWRVSILHYGHLVETVIDRGNVGDPDVPTRACIVGQGQTIAEANEVAWEAWLERHSPVQPMACEPASEPTP